MLLSCSAATSGFIQVWMMRVQTWNQNNAVRFGNIATNIMEPNLDLYAAHVLCLMMLSCSAFCLMMLNCSEFCLMAQLQCVLANDAQLQCVLLMMLSCSAFCLMMLSCSAFCLIPETISAPWGVYSSIAAITAHIGPGLINQLCPHSAFCTHLAPGWREAIMIKCLAQGHKCHGRDSNPHSAANTRTWVR